MLNRVLALIVIFFAILIVIVSFVSVDEAVKIGVDAIVVVLIIGIVIFVSRMFTR